MSKIANISLSRFRNNEHFGFMSDVNKLIIETTAEILGITGIYPSFHEALLEEENSMQVELGSLKSENIEKLDQKRDNTWAAIKGRVKATLKSPFDAEAESARALMRVIDLYGNVTRISLVEESAALRNLVSALESTQNAGYLLDVGIGSWVDELKAVNEQLQVLMNERNTEYSGRVSGDVRIVRLIIDPLYEQIVEIANASVTLKVASPEMETFIDKLNQKIKSFKILMNSHGSRTPENEVPAESL